MFAETLKNMKRLQFVKRIIFYLLFILVATACQASTPIPNPDPPGGKATVDILRTIADRYGDHNGNGVVDMPNTVEYVLQGPLQVTLNARRLAQSYPSVWPYEDSDSAGFGSEEGPWRWTLAPSSEGAVPQDIADLPTPTSTIEGYTAISDGQKIVTYSDIPVLTIGLFEGEWSIELARIDTSGNPVYWKTDDVRLTDVLVVQLGDSASSGEGAPDRESQSGLWGDDGTGQNGEHKSAHRSSNTWGSVVALKIEALDPNSSVTYINLARTGAQIDDLPAQLTQLSTLVGPRKVDTLFISIGGNDAGFKNVIAAFLAREPINNFPDLGPDFGDIKDAIDTGHWTGGTFTDVGSVLLEVFDFATDHDWKNVKGVEGRLLAGYRDVAIWLDSNMIDAADVYILQYPDPFLADPGDRNAVCPAPVLTNVASLFGRQLEVGTAEQHRARDWLIKPLNDQIARAAEESGWNVIDAERVFSGHAICQDDRMVVRHNESINRQGDKRGTLHPNKAGYEAIAKRAFDVWFGSAGN